VREAADRGWIDVSVPLTSGMAHWPGDPVPIFKQISEIARGADANVTLSRMTAHTGTHMDAPRHFLAGGSGIDQFPLEVGVGRARVIGCGDARAIGRAEIEGRRIQKGERILFKTRNSGARWDNREFQRDFVGLDATAAKFLAEAGVALVGIDYLSIGRFEADGVETHKTLLGAGIWIVEGLNLAGVAEGEYDMVCLPLRIEGCDGSPARVALRPA
jgi:arylformamidase